jgi:hypothetical protein
MPDGTGLDGRDEPARGADDHAELLSELDSHDLALPMAADEAAPTDVFAVESDAPPAAVFPQSVASGGPTPTARSWSLTASPKARSNSTRSPTNTGCERRIAPDLTGGIGC